LKNTFNDLCQSNDLKIYRTKLCKFGRSVATENDPTSGFLFPQGTMLCQQILLAKSKWVNPYIPFHWSLREIWAYGERRKANDKDSGPAKRALPCIY